MTFYPFCPICAPLSSLKYIVSQEGSASFTELLRVAQYSLGTEHFFALMVSLRSYHLVVRIIFFSPH